MFGLFKKKPLPPVFPVVDLGSFTLDDLKLGEPLPDHSEFRPHFVDCETDEADLEYENPESGVHVTVTNGVVDSFFLSLSKFKGEFRYHGSAVGIRHESTEAEVSQIMGEPYWKDVDEEAEVIDFYEFQNGGIEIQFEYPPMCQLSFITMLAPGILSKADQRESYKVTKPWPPSN